MKKTHRLDVGDGSVVLVPGDLHFGSNDLVAFSLMVEAAEHFGITDIVLQGDTFDGAALSSHSKEARRTNKGELTIQHECEEALEPLRDLRSLVKADKNTAAIGGNHDAQRMDRFVNENPGWDGMSWYDLYAPALVGWTPLEHGTDVVGGPLTYCHGHLLRGLERGGGIAPCRVAATNYPGCSLIFGHSHRCGFDTRPTWHDGRQTITGTFNVGHMQNLDKVGDWCPDPAWQTSFGLVHYHESRGKLLFNVSLARYIKDRRGRLTLMVCDKVFR